MASTQSESLCKPHHTTQHLHCIHLADPLLERRANGTCRKHSGKITTAFVSPRHYVRYYKMEQLNPKWFNVV